MFDNLKADMYVGASVTQWHKRQGKLLHKGRFAGRVYRNNQLIQEVLGKNDITTEGKNHLLDVVYDGETANTHWYIGLIDNASFAALLATDTLASHTGWTELIPGTAYTGNRQEWVKLAASAGSMVTDTDATFPMLQTKTAYGILVASVATGTSGVLMATGAFDATIALQNGDSFKISYTITY